MNKRLKMALSLIGGGLLVNIAAWGFWAWTRTWTPFSPTNPMTFRYQLLATILTIGLLVPLPLIGIGLFMVVSEWVQSLKRKRL